MRVYMYESALFCERCGEAIRAKLDESEKVQKLFLEIAARRNCSAACAREHESEYDSDEYPKGPYPHGGGEADTPQHCDACHVFLENPLTEDGVRYVREAINTFDASAFHHPQAPLRGDRLTIETWRKAYSGG